MPNHECLSDQFSGATFHLFFDEYDEPQGIVSHEPSETSEEEWVDLLDDMASDQMQLVGIAVRDGSGEKGYLLKPPTTRRQQIVYDLKIRQIARLATNSASIVAIIQTDLRAPIKSSF